MLVICCGMPRSGSTLQFNIASRVVCEVQSGQRVPWRSQEDWRKAGEELRQMALSDQIYIIKTHLPSGMARDIADETKSVKFLYVHRDIRDVVASLKIKFKFSFKHALRRVSESLDLEEWLMTRPQSEILVQNYEELLNSLPLAIKNVANFLNVHLDPNIVQDIEKELNIEEAYSRSRKRKVPFEHLRRRINFVLGRKANFADEELMLHPQHVSGHKGAIGIWRDHLTDDELQEIKRVFGERMLRGAHD
ncbi:sulfotransferase domain-containing protein [Rhodovibrio salinarum]|uniref:Sulfotransferase domain-containing protein n=1 Tax=Rhodovibrio salinarum TaxID=1087 RepID=A0A934QH32_9PROT|nr:sulfotransferase domain-containing protein [Rhodovibrio salinarum]MBK1696663.1 hypothetical protein [Rhodovibrio salinarum]